MVKPELRDLKAMIGLIKFASPEQLAGSTRCQRAADPRALRPHPGAVRPPLGIYLHMVRGWEDQSLVAAAVTLLRVIWAESDAGRRVVAAE
jgi:hypothetical protein